MFTLTTSFLDKRFFLFFLFFPLSLYSFEALYISSESNLAQEVDIFILSTFEDTSLKNIFLEKGNQKTTPYIEEKKPIPSLEKKYTLHKASFKSLEPGERYEIFVEGSPHEPLFFSTPPLEVTQPFIFAAGGDLYHDSVESLEKMHAQVASQKPLFALLGGDLAYSFSKKSAKKEDMERWVTFFTSWYKKMRTTKEDLIPIIAAIGNHEVKGGYFGTPKEAVGFYTFFPYSSYRKVKLGGDIELFLLDSAHTHPIEGAQTTWLKEELTNSTAAFKIALYHVPAYPSYRHPQSKISKKVRRSWVPLFLEKGVDIAFENHDHTLKATRPIFSKNHTHKMFFLGDGSWGISEPRNPALSLPYLAFAKNAQAVWIVTLDKEKMNYQALSVEGNVVYELPLSYPKK